MRGKIKERPTSGKHYAREYGFAKRKGRLEPPNNDKLNSAVAKNFETSKKVEGLLNRLANYMAGEIPDNDDLTDLFGKKPNDDPHATGTDMMSRDDDATTNYTKDEPLPKLNSLSLEPIYGAPVGPPETMRSDAADIPAIKKAPQMVISENVSLDEPPYSDEYVPTLEEILGSRRKKPHVTKTEKKKKPDDLFIYKDFETSLTPVKAPVR